MPRETEPTREEVLAWMQENGAGYARAAREFWWGDPRDQSAFARFRNTVKQWDRRAKVAGAKGRPAPQPQNRGRAKAKAKPAVPPKKESAARKKRRARTKQAVMASYDPAAETREVYLARVIRELEVEISDCRELGHSNVAATYLRLQAGLVKDLDDIRSTKAGADVKPWSSLPQAERLARWSRMVATLPDVFLEVARDELGERLAAD